MVPVSRALLHLTKVKAFKDADKVKRYDFISTCFVSLLIFIFVVVAIVIVVAVVVDGCSITFEYILDRYNVDSSVSLSV